MAKFEIKDDVAIIPEGTTEIGDYAFGGCDSLESVTIPESVTEIGEKAFSDCCYLESIAIPKSVTRIGDLAFVRCTSLESIVVADDNPAYDSRKGCNAIIETETNTLIAGCNSTIIPNDCQTIGEYAFYYSTIKNSKNKVVKHKDNRGFLRIFCITFVNLL